MQSIYLPKTGGHLGFSTQLNTIPFRIFIGLQTDARQHRHTALQAISLIRNLQHRRLMRYGQNRNFAAKLTQASANSSFVFRVKGGRGFI